MVDFLIGCDPELFVRDTEGKLVSAYNMIPGTKAMPFEVDGGAVQVDGMALEFNIDPAATYEQFTGNITKVLNQLQGMIPNGYTFDFSPVAEFGKEYIDAQPDAAKELGCDPDFDAYTGLANPKPDTNLGIRTASGHIHIGWTEGQDVTDPDHIEACHMLTKQLDISTGLLSRVWDRDTVRSQMYGALGAYRPKHYGVEYRTLSNVWVKDERTRKMVFDSAMNAAQKLLNGTRLYESYYYADYEYYHKRRAYYDLFRNVQSIVSSYKLIDKSLLKELADIYNEQSNNPFSKEDVEKVDRYGNSTTIEWYQNFNQAVPPVLAGGGLAALAADFAEAIDEEVFDEFIPEIEDHEEDL